MSEKGRKGGGRDELERTMEPRASREAEAEAISEEGSSEAAGC